MPPGSNNTEPVVELVEPPIEQPAYLLRQRGCAIPDHPGEAVIHLLPRCVLMLFHGVRVHEGDLLIRPVPQVIILDLLEVGQVNSEKVLIVGVGEAEGRPMVVKLPRDHKPQGHDQDHLVVD